MNVIEKMETHPVGTAHELFLSRKLSNSISHALESNMDIPISVRLNYEKLMDYYLEQIENGN